MDEKRPPLPERNRAVGLLVLAVVVGLPVLVYLMLPEVSRKRVSKRRATCQSNLRQIGLACHMYADYHEERFPPDLLALVPDYIDGTHIFCCASTGSRAKFRDMDLREAAAKSHYAYAGAGLWVVGCPEDMILAYDKSLEHHDKEGHESGRNVLFADAHVEWWPASREAEFQKKLAEQREAVRKWRAAGAKKADMDKFFGKLGEKEPK